MSTMSKSANTSSNTPEVKSALPPPLPKAFRAFYTLIRDTDGRDKALKFLQYAFRYLKYLTVHNKELADSIICMLLASPECRSLAQAFASKSKAAVASNQLSTAVLLGWTERLDLWAGSFSQARKVIRLFKWCYTIPLAWKNWHKWRREMWLIRTHAVESRSIRLLCLPGMKPLPFWSTLELVNSLIAIATDMSDDCDWYSKHRVLPAAWNARFARTTVVLWFITVFGDIAISTRALMNAKDAASKQPEDASKAEAVEGASLTLIKFLADFGVALPTYLQQQSKYDGIVQSMGAISALVGVYKILLTAK